jgi:hypothetical protein
VERRYVAQREVGQGYVKRRDGKAQHGDAPAVKHKVKHSSAMALF